MINNVSVSKTIKICIVKIIITMISIILYGLTFEGLIEIINREYSYISFIGFYVLFMLIFSIVFILLLTDTICEITHALKLIIILKIKKKGDD